MATITIGKKLSRSCIITGGAGFIGTAISSKLASVFDRVVIVDNFHPQVHEDSRRPANLDPRVDVVVGNVADSATWDNLLPTVAPDLVIHLAAETGTAQSLSESTRHAFVNVVGSSQMLDAFLRHSVVPRRILLASSRAVYGEGEWVDGLGNRSYPGQRSKAMLDQKIWDFPGLKCLPFDSFTTHPRPTSVYGATKLAQENIFGSWAKSFGVDLAILRLQNVYGPGQSLTNSYTGIVPFFMRMARKKQSIPVYEDGEIIRDFIYIDDVAEAILLFARSEGNFETIYDVGLGRPISLYFLAQKIADCYGAPSPHITGQYRHGDVRHASCSMERTVARLGWSPIWGVDKSIEALRLWIEEKLGDGARE
ncbi:NAD-dependent epimerase/dehydratase family protein [Agrobacterium rubi]|uniref:NAD-dependent epimerase/dehydratase family protein n=1 Tax=Agrobacterium rubi TaxID=28099 RepID=UPI000ABDDABB|nr:NAD-dependent epimerase/dehydratase family protein [Agrobacterium rubi]MBP1881550.1 dTDP-L-rhamnose 4-epimerase [Agrobacterium rubi]